MLNINKLSHTSLKKYELNIRILGVKENKNIESLAPLWSLLEIKRYNFVSVSVQRDQPNKVVEYDIIF